MAGIAMRSVAALALVGTALLGAPACGGPECGPGTREADGLCVPVTGINGDGGVHCGENTVLVGTECVPSEELCGPYTEVEAEVDEFGVPTGGFICVGQAVEEGEPPPECPPEFGPAGEICINGYAHWLVDEGAGVHLMNVIGDPDAAEDATTAVVKVYDPLLYAEDPDNTVPLGTAQVNPRWGTFRIMDIPIPGTGFVALVLDDWEYSGQELYAMAGAPYVGTPNQHLEGVVVFGIGNEQMLSWTEAVGGDTLLQSLGCPAPPGGGPRTMSSCGTWVGIYVDKTPSIEAIDTVEGVIPYEPGGPVPEHKKFFAGITADGTMVFNDPTPGVVWSDDEGPHPHTGVLGTIFYPSASLGNMTGECAPETTCADAGCIFMEVLGGSVRGAFFVQFMLPVTCGG